MAGFSQSRSALLAGWLMVLSIARMPEVQAASWAGARLISTGSIWHEGRLEVALPVRKGIIDADLVGDSAVVPELGLSLEPKGVVAVPGGLRGSTQNRFVVRVDGVPSPSHTGAARFLGLPDGSVTEDAISGAALIQFRDLSPMSWTVVGANESGGTNQVVAMPQSAISDLRSFEVLGAGAESSGGYDEMVFLHDSITGDFDRVVEVTWVALVSGFGGAGIMLREGLDAGKPRGTAGFSRFVSVEVPGADPWGSRGVAFVARLEPGGDVGLVKTSPQAAFGSAWLRLVRSGDSIQSSYRLNRPSSPKDVWEALGTLVVPGLAPTLYVGPHYSAQMKFALPGWNDAGQLPGARFDNYGAYRDLFVAVDRGDALSLHTLGQEKFLYWGGWLFGRSRLETSADLQRWEQVPGFPSAPLVLGHDDEARFYRLAD